MVPDMPAVYHLQKQKKTKKNGTGVCAADLQSSNHTYATRKNKIPIQVKHLGGHFRCTGR